MMFINATVPGLVVSLEVARVQVLTDKPACTTWALTMEDLRRLVIQRVTGEMLCSSVCFIAAVEVADESLGGSSIR